MKEIDEELLKFYRLSEKEHRIFFEYSYSADDISMFKYRDSRRELIDEADPLNVLKPMIMNSVIATPAGDNSIDFFKAYNLNGTDHYVRGIIISEEDGTPVKMFGTVSTRKSDSTPDLTRTSKIDAMTGLYSREYALSLTHKAIESHHYKKVSLILIDIDNFKSINEAYGTMFGDEVIRRLSIILRDAAYGRGFAARFGGDEFFLCIYNLDDEDALRAVLSTIVYHYKTAFSEKDFKFTLSQGISEYPRNSEDFSVLMKKAERALQKAKFKGQDRFIIYKEELHGELPESEMEDSAIPLDDMRLRDAQGNFMKKALPELVSIARSTGLIPERIGGIMKECITAFRLNGISVYTGRDLTCAYRFGDYSKPLDNVSYMNNPKVWDCFSNDRVYSGQVRGMKQHYIESFHGDIAAHNLEFSMHVVTGTFEDIKVVVTFDREKYLGSNSAFENQSLTILGRMLAELLA